MTNNKKLHIPHVARTTGLSIGLVLTFLVCSFITSAEYQSTTDLPGGDAQQLRVPVVSGDWLASGKKNQTSTN